MLRSIIISGICVIVIMTGSNLPKPNMGGERFNMDIAITNKEDAISIGTAILRSKYEVSSDSKFDAQDRGNTWKVYSYVPPSENLDGTTTITKGGSVYVIVSKKDGQITEIGLDD